MNAKRLAIATAIGLVCGIFCAHGIWTMGVSGTATFPVTAGLLASTVFNRVLIGFVIGISDGIKLHPVLRGALMGAIVSLSVSVMPIVDGQLYGGLIMVAFGVVYGVIADVAATRFSRE